MRTINGLTTLTLLVLVIALSLSLMTMAKGAFIWSVQVPYLGTNGLPHDFDYFREIKELGYNTVLITVPWGAVEYAPNKYDFSILDAYMNYTRELGLNVILVFFYSVSAASGDPNPIPTWLLANGELEVNPYGQAQSPPALAWWNSTDRQYYFNFIKTVVARYVNYPNFLGVLVDFGWLDDDWGPGVNGLPGGYALSDILAFRAYLNDTYGGNITKLNEQWHTLYRSFNEITPSQPFIGNWPYFQEFRVWSINVTYSELFGMIRGLIGPNKMLLFYWGGAIDDIYGLQMPELYFQLARRYNVTIILDDADVTTNAIFFSDMANAYRVHIMMEWTPVPSTGAYYGKYISHIMYGYPWLIGGDYYVFIRSLAWFYPTAQLNAMASELYRLINGSHVRTNVALLYVTMYGETYNQWISLRHETQLIPTGLVAVGNGEYAYYPYDIITADELSQGLVNLSNYKYLILLVPSSYVPSNVMNTITKWRSSGGVLITFNSEWLSTGLGNVLSSIESPLLITNASVEVFPIVNGNSAYIAFNDYGNPINVLHVCINLTSLGLPNGTYVVIDLNNGEVVNVTNGGYASFNLHFYNTQSAVLVGILPAELINVMVNVTNVNISYHYNASVLNLNVSGVISPPGNYEVIALVHTNVTQPGFYMLSFPSINDGLVYLSVGAGSTIARDGDFTINLTLPIYQLTYLYGYVTNLILNIYVIKNGYVLGGYSYTLGLNITLPTPPAPPIVGISVVSVKPLITTGTTQTTSASITTTSTTTTLTTTMVITKTITSSLIATMTSTITLTSTIIKPVLTGSITASLIILVIVLVTLLLVVIRLRRTGRG